MKSIRINAVSATRFVFFSSDKMFVREQQPWRQIYDRDTLLDIFFKLQIFRPHSLNNAWHSHWNFKYFQTIFKQIEIKFPFKIEIFSSSKSLENLNIKNHSLFIHRDVIPHSQPFKNLFEIFPNNPIEMKTNFYKLWPLSNWRRLKLFSRYFAEKFFSNCHYPVEINLVISSFGHFCSFWLDSGLLLRDKKTRCHWLAFGWSIDGSRDVVGGGRCGNGIIWFGRPGAWRTCVCSFSSFSWIPLVFPISLTLNLFSPSICH